MQTQSLAALAADCRWVGYVFGGFGTLLFIASILCFIAWKPLGEPAPQASNLALAIVLLKVIIIQTAFVSIPYFDIGDDSS
jgi:hypothetical protein